MNDRSAIANITAVMGATGTGKTSKVIAEIKRDKPARLLVWDAKGEFANEGFGHPVYSMSELVRLMDSAKDGRKRFKLCYQPRGNGTAKKKQFDIFCQAAFKARNMVVICEELSEVTTPTHAPYGWELVSSQGRAKGLQIYGLSQNPAQIDKAFFGNCTRIICFRLNFKSHVMAMADCLFVPGDYIRLLPNGTYIERSLSTHENTRGKVF